MAKSKVKSKAAEKKVDMNQQRNELRLIAGEWATGHLVSPVGLYTQAEIEKWNAALDEHTDNFIDTYLQGILEQEWIDKIPKELRAELESSILDAQPGTSSDTKPKETTGGKKKVEPVTIKVKRQSKAQSRKPREAEVRNNDFVGPDMPQEVLNSRKAQELGDAPSENGLMQDHDAEGEFAGVTQEQHAQNKAKFEELEAQKNKWKTGWRGAASKTGRALKVGAGALALASPWLAPKLMMAGAAAKGIKSAYNYIKGESPDEKENKSSVERNTTSPSVTPNAVAPGQQPASPAPKRSIIDSVKGMFGFGSANSNADSLASAAAAESGAEGGGDESIELLKKIEENTRGGKPKDDKDDKPKSLFEKLKSAIETLKSGLLGAIGKILPGIVAVLTSIKTVIMSVVNTILSKLGLKSPVNPSAPNNQSPANRTTPQAKNVPVDKNGKPLKGAALESHNKKVEREKLQNRNKPGSGGIKSGMGGMARLGMGAAGAAMLGMSGANIMSNDGVDQAADEVNHEAEALGIAGTVASVLPGPVGLAVGAAAGGAAWIGRKTQSYQQRKEKENAVALREKAEVGMGVDDLKSLSDEGTVNGLKDFFTGKTSDKGQKKAVIEEMITAKSEFTPEMAELVKKKFNIDVPKELISETNTSNVSKSDSSNNTSNVSKSDSTSNVSNVSKSDSSNNTSNVSKSENVSNNANIVSKSENVSNNANTTTGGDTNSSNVSKSDSTSNVSNVSKSDSKNLEIISKMSSMTDSLTTNISSSDSTTKAIESVGNAVQNVAKSVSSNSSNSSSSNVTNNITMRNTTRSSDSSFRSYLMGSHSFA